MVSKGKSGQGGAGRGLLSRVRAFEGGFDGARACMQTSRPTNGKSVGRLGCDDASAPAGASLGSAVLQAAAIPAREILSNSKRLRMHGAQALGSNPKLWPHQPNHAAIAVECLVRSPTRAALPVPKPQFFPKPAVGGSGVWVLSALHLPSLARANRKLACPIHSCDVVAANVHRSHGAFSSFVESTRECAVSCRRNSGGSKRHIVGGGAGGRTRCPIVL